MRTVGQGLEAQGTRRPDTGVTSDREECVHAVVHAGMLLRHYTPSLAQAQRRDSVWADVPQRVRVGAASWVRQHLGLCWLLRVSVREMTDALYVEYS